MAGAGAAAGFTGPLLLHVPLRFCTFGAEAALADRALGYLLAVAGAALALRLAWTLLDPVAAKARARSSDTTTHGVFRNHPVLPWLLLAPTLIILILFLYWPAGAHRAAVDQAGAAREPRRRSTAASPTSPSWSVPAAPVLLGVTLLAITLFFASSWLKRRGDQAAERWAGYASTAGVGLA
jgi:sn-glycerol 3-phosphate transport system permease protein